MVSCEIALVTTLNSLHLYKCSLWAFSCAAIAAVLVILAMMEARPGFVGATNVSSVRV